MKGKAASSTKAKIKGGIQAAAIATAGIYASYGPTAVPDAPQAAYARESRRPQKIIKYVWSESEEYKVQNNFLKIVYSAYTEGSASKLGRAVNDAYVRSKAKLGKLFDGEFADDVDVTLKRDHLLVELTYKPNADSKHKKYEKVKITYKIAVYQPREFRRISRYPRVEVVKWAGYLAEKKAWEDIEIPEDMQPTEMKKEEAGADNCGYPRWNPRGVRYGFIKRGAVIR